MPANSEVKTLSDFTISVPPIPDVHDEDNENYDIYLEIEELRRKMLAERSPGAAMLIKRMEVLDFALDKLHDAIDNFAPGDYNKNHTPDLMIRRYIWLKTNMSKFILDYVGQEIESRVNDFHLTRANTCLPPTWWALAPARAWRRNYNRERVKEAREARAAQKHAAARMTAVRLILQEVVSTFPATESNVAS